ncbi:MAG: hypothetical protein DSY66_03485 [Persephonella sp.]|nr:MAG: hypothetical protein DSY66_03485 [Persephonella sp.]
MKVAYYDSYGDYTNIKFGEFPRPEIENDNEVLVRIKAFSLNHLDIWIMEGKYPLDIPMPHIFASDCSGIVEKVGEGVKTALTSTATAATLDIKDATERPTRHRQNRGLVFSLTSGIARQVASAWRPSSGQV